MVQVRKLEGQVEVKCDADKLFDIFARNVSQVSKMCPDKLPKIELLEGDNCHTVGSIISWTYATPIDGKYESSKTKLGEIDEGKRSYAFEVIEGDIIDKHYKSWKESIQVIPKGENCSIVKWSVDCEKKSEDAPDLNKYVELFIDCVKDTYSRLYSSA